MTPTAAALLVVDMQAGLFAAPPYPFALADVIARINVLAERARAAGMPVIFVQHEAAGRELEFGSPSWQLDERLQLESSDLRLRKSTSAPYASSNLKAILDDHAIRSV